MDLTSIKNMLFSTTSSSRVITAPAARGQIPPIPETLFAYNSQNQHRSSADLVPNLSLSEALNPDIQSDGRELSRTDILLGVLPVLQDLIGRCEAHSNDQAVRNGASYNRTAKFVYLGRASAAISLLEKHLTSIQETGHASELNDAITQLDQCLGSMLVRKPLLLEYYSFHGFSLMPIVKYRVVMTMSPRKIYYVVYGSSLRHLPEMATIS